VSLRTKSDSRGSAGGTELAAIQCWTAAQLEDFVKALTAPDSARR